MRGDCVRFLTRWMQYTDCQEVPRTAAEQACTTSCQSRRGASGLHEGPLFDCGRTGPPPWRQAAVLGASG